MIGTGRIRRAVGWASAGAIGLLAAASAVAEPIAIKADAVHVGDGTVFRPGVVVIEDGKIVAAGADVPVPGGATVIEAQAVTPGLIDANARIEPTDLAPEGGRPRQGVLGRILHAHRTDRAIAACMVCSRNLMACELTSMHSSFMAGDDCPVCGYPGHAQAEWALGVRPDPRATEASSEVVPHTRVLDHVPLRSPDFEILAREGVTTVYAAPDSTAVIGPRGAVVRTDGPARTRVLQSSAGVRAAINSSPYREGLGNGVPSMFGVTERTRRPNTRMGVAWVFRKAMAIAQGASEGVATVEGADAPDPEAVPYLVQVLSGELPLRVHARFRADIESALRLCDEFGLSFTLLEGTDAYEVMDQLRDAGVPIVYGPIDMDAGRRPSNNENRNMRFGTVRTLLDAGLVTALSAQDRRGEDGLARQAMYARRAGLSLDEALRAVTLTPAEMLGVDDRVGSLSAGKRADVVVWSGEPFGATSRPIAVLIEGEIVADMRGGKDN